MQTAVQCYAQPLNNGICTAYEYVLWDYPFLSCVYKLDPSRKYLEKDEFNLLQIFIYIHKIMFAPQSIDLFEKLEESLLYNFHRENTLLKLKYKKVIANN